MNTSRFLVLSWVGSLLAAAPVVRADDYAPRIAALREQVVLAAANFDKSMAGPKPEPEIRHLACAGFCDLALDGDATKAESYFRKVFALQNMDKSSRDFGDVAWRINHPEVKDSNSIEFTMSFLAPALIRFDKQLSEPFKKEAQEHMKAAVIAVRRHQPPVTYANIYLMRLANLMMLGEYVNDASAVQEGKDNLDTWLAWTRVYGINEFDSPTYSPVQVTDLENVYIHAPDDATKALAKAGLDYLWSDLCANYFAGRDSVGGPHSRSYDFLYQKGTLQKYYYLEGVAPNLDGKDYLGGLWLNAIDPRDYHPAPEIVALARIPERVVQQRYGIEPGRDKYNWLMPDFVIGSIGCYYGPQDEQMSVEFASPAAKKLPVCWVVQDTWDAPFGKVTATDKSGHVKPRHLKDIVASVQEKGRVLALIDSAPDLKHDEAKSIATDIVLPAQADALYLDGEKLPKDKAFERPASPESIVYVREGKAAAAFRIFNAGGVDGQKPVFAVKYDANEWGAARLVAYHYSGKPLKAGDHPILAGVYMQAATCANDEEFNAFVAQVKAVKIEQKLAEKQWSASVKAGDTTLETAMELGAQGPLYRRVNGQEITSHALMVNGRDLAAEILGGLSLKSDISGLKPKPATAVPQ